MHDGISDEDLMEAYRDGALQAFDTLFRRYQDKIYRYVLRQIRNTAEAEEVFQEVWAALIKNRRTYTVQAKFKTYLFRICHSKIIDYYRARSREALESYDDLHEAGFDIADTAVTLDIQVDTQQKVSQLMRLLDKLPASQREVFLLHEEADMSLNEIAQVINVSRDTAKSRLRYALERLRRDMAKYA